MQPSGDWNEERIDKILRDLGIRVPAVVLEPGDDVADEWAQDDASPEETASKETSQLSITVLGSDPSSDRP